MPMADFARVGEAKIFLVFSKKIDQPSLERYFSLSCGDVGAKRGGGGGERVACALSQLLRPPLSEFSGSAPAGS